MSGRDFSDTPPPEVPEDYADAYREAYRKAYEEAVAEFPEAPPLTEDQDDQPDDDLGAPATNPATNPAEPAEVPERILPPLPAALAARASAAAGQHAGVLPPAAESTRTMRVGSHRAAATDQSALPTFADLRGSAWFKPVLVALSVLLLIVVAYLLGRLFGGGDDATAPPGSSTSATQQPTGASTSPRSAYQGPITRTSVASATASCTSKPGVDSSGRKVSYGVGHAIDARADTAWRCDGTAIGARLVLRLRGKEPIGEVGLIPGYAKTDSKSHVDRYAQNNRITKVRWTFADGSHVDQTMSGNPKDRSLRTLRVPRTTSATVTLQILAVTRGPRNTTAISTVLVGLAG